MLSSLRIQNVVLIEKLDIAFQGGLCTLTGETGAGKSILLDSLGLATGARADSGLVRKGADKASVTATFEVAPDHIAKAILEDQDLEFDEILMLRRTLKPDGKSRAYINDQPVSAGLLKTIGQTLLEVHGQFDTQGLLDPKTHRKILDDYAQIDGGLGTAWDEWRAAERKLTALKDTASASAEQEDYLRQSLEDLDALEPQAGEEKSLADLRESLMHREQVMEALNVAYHILNGDSDPIREAWSALDKVADKIGEQASEAINALDRASAETGEALIAIQTLSSDIEHSEHNLETIDDRLFGLRAQARKHHCAVDDLADKREQLAQQLNAIEHADDILEDAAKAAQIAKDVYHKKALEISGKRKKSAQMLDALVAKELTPLKLERARFVTDVKALSEEDWTKHGIDRIRFLVATNPGSDPGPLNKIASGGEMSRFMLALKVVMAEVGAAGALVFDEVDAGIGGSTADAVGERLAALSRKKQVLVVTHSPQVAARGNHHYIVSKQGDKTLTTSVIALDNDQARREEIARMLAGAEITIEARAAADKLLETSRAA
ncbi:MAG: DNA repair protein RecN [Alphaproteobacteria bacterium]|nr:DNA repair protein RecN [Alphaproteobacteria bacterium]